MADLVETSKAVAGTASRLEKIDRLAALLKRVSPTEVARGFSPASELEIAIAFLSGTPRQGRIGIAGRAFSAVRETGPAESASLELTDVDDGFARVAAVSGSGSSAARIDILRDLFRRATRDEQDFLVRLIVGELRQGALEGILVEAVARASGVAADRIRRAAMMAGALAPVARAALAGGEHALDSFDVQLFRPIDPMLAQSADSVEAALAELGATSLEYKLDGARIQVHKAGDDVRVYTRNLRDVSPAVPEIVEAARALPARDIILDGEAIALRADGTPWPFQVTMRRFGRKLDVEAMRRQLPISPAFFDALYVDGHPLLDEPLATRTLALDGIVPASWRVPRIASVDAPRAAAFFEQAIAAGHEGVMAKALEGAYAAGRRGQAWIKIKRARTLDLVVLAAEWGHGRRRGTLSNLHLGARDGEGFVMLGKTFKGMTDEMLAWQTKRLLELEVARDDSTVYVRPALVVEVAFNEIQESQYPGGVALRFARVKRYRTDKSPAESDTLATVRGMHAAEGVPRATDSVR